jgi:dsDNA-binding SOS-regulon protein
MPPDRDPSASMTDEQRLAWFEAQAEAAYDKMYDATHSTDAAARYSDVKEAMRDAIALAQRLGQDAVATRLKTQLAHIKAVFRSQFS